MKKDIKMKRRIEKQHLFFVELIICVATFTSCHDIETVIPPTIDMKTTEFTVKPNRDLLIEPEVKNSDVNAVYSWLLNGKVIGTKKDLIFKENEVGIYYVKFKVVTKNGTAQRDIKIIVTDLTPPIISFNEARDEFILETGEEHIFKPEIKNTEGLKLKWMMDDKEISSANEYKFVSDKEGAYFITLIASNNDGKSEYLIKIFVVKETPLNISFTYPEQSASLGRSIRIIPVLPSTKNVKFHWFVNGKEDKKQTSDKFIYKPESLGISKIKVIATKGNKKGESSIVVKTLKPEQYFRPFKAGNSPFSNKVYEFTPAPGQFVNEGYTANTMTEACKYAENRLKRDEKGKTQYVSLGAWGGYIIVGFDHSIENKGDYDFAIWGNSFKGNSEPGIVWVMQDENGNGLPDDNWYELKGSETGKPETIQDYEVTYFRPSPSSDTHWIDNRGKKGYVDYLASFHRQPFYYPNWVHSNSYTLRGTCLKSRTHDESGKGGYWVNDEFDWGYVDNFSPIDRLTDDINYNASANANHFKISNAITFDMKPIHLKYIDFIKVQTGVNAKAGWLGEISTEVFEFIDIHAK